MNDSYFHDGAIMRRLGRQVRHLAVRAIWLIAIVVASPVMYAQSVSLSFEWPSSPLQEGDGALIIDPGGLGFDRILILAIREGTFTVLVTAGDGEQGGIADHWIVLENPSAGGGSPHQALWLGDGGMSWSQEPTVAPTIPTTGTATTDTSQSYLMNSDSDVWQLSTADVGPISSGPDASVICSGVNVGNGLLGIGSWQTGLHVDVADGNPVITRTFDIAITTATPAPVPFSYRGQCRSFAVVNDSGQITGTTTEPSRSKPDLRTNVTTADQRVLDLVDNRRPWINSPGEAMERVYGQTETLPPANS